MRDPHQSRRPFRHPGDSRVKIDFDGIQAFVAVAETGGFQRAALQLHLTQTALTRRVQKLESHLGLRLLDRTTRSVALTAVGRDFLPKAKSLVDGMHSAVVQLRETARTARGGFTLACISTLSARLLPVLVRKYAEQHAGNRIRLLDLVSTQVRQSVIERQAEVGIAIRGEEHPELQERPLFDDALVFYCHESHPLAKRPRLAWADLKGVELVAVRTFTATNGLTEYQLARNGIGAAAAYDVQHYATAINLVAAGVGCAILPWSIVGTKDLPQVRKIELAGPVVHRKVTICTRRHACLSPAAQAFVDLVNGVHERGVRPMRMAD